MFKKYKIINLFITWWSFSSFDVPSSPLLCKKCGIINILLMTNAIVKFFPSGL
jgi:hypothetical protein